MMTAVPGSKSSFGEALATISTIGVALLTTFVALDYLRGNPRSILMALLAISLLGVFTGAALSKGVSQAVIAVCAALALAFVMLGAVLLFGGSGTELGGADTDVGDAVFHLTTAAWVAGVGFGLCGFILSRSRRNKKSEHAV
jgi:hypothetical protein